ncbi:MAG: hypothetical protein ACKOHI_05945, partial [Phycisphaerales bacterium]
STTYNFRFDANAAPVNRTAALGLWKAPPSGVTEVELAVAVKGPDGNSQPPCPTGDFNCDYVVDGNDLGYFLSKWGTEGGAFQRPSAAVRFTGAAFASKRKL